MKRLRLGAAALVTLFVLLAPTARAQTIRSTFGPGDSYSGSGDAVSSGRWIGESFLYGGPTGAFLSALRFAGRDATGAGPLTVSFLDGLDINTATALESWVLPSVGPTSNHIYSVASVGHPTLTSGDTYWMELSTTSGFWVWLFNDQGDTGGFAQTSGGSTFTSSPTAADMAYDVTVTPPVTTGPTATPEPATLTLMATGLVGVVGVARRRRKA